MTVYADILVITNFIVDYFLLKITAKSVKREPKTARMLLASFAAALFSLVILLPKQNAFAEILFRVILCVGVCLICFGRMTPRRLAAASLVFFAVTFAFAGAMMAISYIFGPFGIVVNNSAVYFDISPLYLICFSVAGFLIFSLFSSLFAARSKHAKSCFVTLDFCGKKGDFAAIIDSGNSLSDPVGARAVIIADKKCAQKVFGELSPEIYAEKYRAIPCGTVSGSGLLDAYRCESGKIITEKKTFDLNRPIMAISKTPLCDCEAIVNPIDCAY